MKFLTFILSLFFLNCAFASLEKDMSYEIQDDLKLSEEDRDLIETTLINEKDPYAKGRIFFCSQVGFATVVDILSLRCRNFKKKESYTLNLIGIGASISIHGGLAIMYPKKKSRNLKIGTYDGYFKAIHLGAGIYGLNFMNDNQSIFYRIRGLSLGAGFNFTYGRLMVDY